LRAAYSARAAWPLERISRSRSGSSPGPKDADPPKRAARMSATESEEPMWPTFARRDCSITIWRIRPPRSACSTALFLPGSVATLSDAAAPLYQAAPALGGAAGELDVFGPGRLRDEAFFE